MNALKVNQDLHNIGYLDIYPVMYNKKEKTVLCKDLVFLLKDLVNHYTKSLKSNSYREQINLVDNPKECFFSHINFFYSIGCLSAKKQELDTMLERIRKIKSNK